MKRLHIHVSVNDVDESARFYAALFAAEPTVKKPDYAKWMLDDPRVNFAISARGRKAGIEHLGIQAEDETELGVIFERLAQAERPTLAEQDTTCCYARSEKQWVADPQGVVWETFYTHGESTVYGQSAAIEDIAGAICCEPQAAAAEISPKAACCSPAQRP
jgi:catechol 2,3-dioxygenase-like lactoylglutathione lyase family enzyme